MENMKVKAQELWERFVAAISGRRSAVIAGAVVGVMLVTTGGAMAMRAATNQFADATISRLGGDDPQAVLDAIAEKVVKQLMGEDGPFGGVSADLGRVAGDKLAGIDTDSLIDRVSSQVAEAGMGKLNSISTETILKQVTAALVERAMSEIRALDLQALARSTLDGAVDDLLASVDLE